MTACCCCPDLRRFRSPGLTEQLATLRLGVEPALRDLFIRVTKLPLVKTGPTALKPFGYDLFDRPISTFAPATNVPVPADYVLARATSSTCSSTAAAIELCKLVVGRDGRVSFPEIGPVSVAGQTFDECEVACSSRGSSGR